MKTGMAVVVALVGMLGSRAAMADGDLVIVLQHAANVAEKLPDSNTLVTVIVSVAAVMISSATFVIGYMQMRIASTKVKLDLYNKRFSVYLAVLEYYQIIRSESKDVLEEKLNKFIHAFRESKFLFDVEDKIYERLENIQKKGVVFRTHDDNSKNTESNPDKAWGSSQKAITAHLEMGQEILKLEDQLKDYISFHNVKGWTFF